MDKRGNGVIVYEKNTIIVSIVDATVVVTERDGSSFETSALHTDGRMPASVVDGPQWADALRGHWAMVANLKAQATA